MKVATQASWDFILEILVKCQAWLKERIETGMSFINEASFPSESDYKVNKTLMWHCFNTTCIKSNYSCCTLHTNYSVFYSASVSHLYHIGLKDFSFLFCAIQLQHSRRIKFWHVATWRALSLGVEHQIGFCSSRHQCGMLPPPPVRALSALCTIKIHWNRNNKACDFQYMLCIMVTGCVATGGTKLQEFVSNSVMEIAFENVNLAHCRMSCGVPLRLSNFVTV